MTSKACKAHVCRIAAQENLAAKGGSLLTYFGQTTTLFAISLLTTDSSIAIAWITTLVHEVGVALCVWQPSSVIMHDLRVNDACFIVDTHCL
jgi:hypothetical protein